MPVTALRRFKPGAANGSTGDDEGAIDIPQRCCIERTCCKPFTEVCGGLRRTRSPAGGPDWHDTHRQAERVITDGVIHQEDLDPAGLRQGDPGRGRVGDCLDACRVAHLRAISHRRGLFTGGEIVNPEADWIAGTGHEAVICATVGDADRHDVVTACRQTDRYGLFSRREGRPGGVTGCIDDGVQVDDRLCPGGRRHRDSKHGKQEKQSRAQAARHCARHSVSLECQRKTRLRPQG